MWGQVGRVPTLGFDALNQRLAYAGAMPSATVLDALARRVRADGSAPLLTYYDRDGSRTELSATSYANWVNKTANLITELCDGDEPVVSLRVAQTDPGHWMTLIWPLATWLAGGAVVADTSAAPSVALPDVTLAVVGPTNPSPDPDAQVIACSLHPLGLGLRGLPSWVLDFTQTALSQPDQLLWPSQPRPGVVWHDSVRSLTHADLSSVPADASRRLVMAESPWQCVSDAILSPLLGGGSAVVVADGSTLDLAQVAASERCAA